ncbi:hypothetical protein KAT51_07030, partial [bacterium]|nr:hypothetical protein [bacterium]
KFGGNFSKNKSKFEEWSKKAEELIKDEKYKEAKKELKDILKDFIKSAQKLIENTCFAVIPVKEMPWEDVVFRTVPRIVLDGKKIKYQADSIAYCGEIKCVISRATIFGKMKDAEPLFAPVMGGLDLGGFKLDEAQQKGNKSKIYPYVSAIIGSMDAVTTKSHLAKYHEGYQRHGEPICDHLMKDKDLLESMTRVVSALESKRINTDMAVCGIALPHSDDGKTLLIVTDDGKESDTGRFSRCFEGLLRFSAAGCEAPSSRRSAEGNIRQAGQMTQAAQAQQGPSGPGVGGLMAPAGPAQPGGTVRTPGGQDIKVWTPEELAQDAQSRPQGGVPPGMATWSEEDLAKVASERGSGIPEGMEVWTEDSLEELAKSRQGGGLNIPEWKPDDNLLECAHCGAAMRPGWDECPICEKAVGAAKAPPEPAKEGGAEGQEAPPASAEEKKEEEEKNP